MLTRSAWPGKVERSPAQQALLQATGQRLLIVELHGMLFFGSATQLTQQLEERLLQPDAPAQVVLDFRHVRWLDSSAAQALGRLFKLAARLHVRLALSGLPPAVDQALRAAGALAGPAAALHADIDAAVEAWDQAQLHDAESATVVGLADLDLEAPAAAHLLAHFDTLTLAAGDTLFRQGEASDALYLVRSGRLSAWVKTGAAPGIDEVMVRSILAGGAIGEMGLFRAVRRSATLRADTPAVVMRLQRQRLQQLEQQQPLQALALYRLFLRQLSGRLDQATAQAHALAR
jgi:SulP family sulfate permease